MKKILDRLRTRVDEISFRLAGWGLDQFNARGWQHRDRRSCWLCLNAQASTREHRYKKGIITAVYGRGPYGPDKDRPVRTVGGSGHSRRILSPDAATLKFEKSMCFKCNNERTQEADFVHQRFAEYVLKRSSDLANRGYIDLDEAFPSNRERQLDLLLRALGKQLGCWIAEPSSAPVQRPYDVPTSLRLLVLRGWSSGPVIDVVAARAQSSLPMLLGHGPFMILQTADSIGFWSSYMLGHLVLFVSTGFSRRLGTLQTLRPDTTKLMLYDEAEVASLVGAEPPQRQPGP